MDEPVIFGSVILDGVEGIRRVYKRAHVPVPKYPAFSRRLLEECVELALACGMSGPEILGTVADTLAVEAGKVFQYPIISDLHPPGASSQGVAGEIADNAMLLAWVQKTAGVSDYDVNQATRYKVERLTVAFEAGQLFWTDDGRFYRVDRRVRSTQTEVFKEEGP